MAASTTEDLLQEIADNTAGGGGGGTVSIDNFPADYPDSAAQTSLTTIANNSNTMAIQVGTEGSAETTDIPANAVNGFGIRKMLYALWLKLVQLGSQGTAENAAIPDNATNGFGIRKLLWRIQLFISSLDGYVSAMNSDLNAVRTNTNAGTGFTGSGDSLSQFRALSDGIISTASINHASTANAIFNTVDARGFNTVTFVCTTGGATGSIIIEHSADGFTWQVGGIFYLCISGGTNTKHQGNSTFAANVGTLLIVPVLMRYVRLRISGAGTGTSTWAAKYQQDNLLIYEADYNRVDNATVNATIQQPSVALALVPATGTKIISTATTNATLCASGNKAIVALSLTNTGGGPAYFKIFNKATAPLPVSDVPVWIYCIPAGQTINPVFPAYGLRPGTNGLGYAITGGAADLDTTAVALNQVVGSIFYV